MDKVKVNKKLLLIGLIILFTITLYHLVHSTLCKPETFQQLSMMSDDLIKVQMGNTIPLSQIAESEDIHILSKKIEAHRKELQTILDDLTQFQLKATAEYSNDVGGEYKVTIEGKPGKQVVNFSVPTGRRGPKGGNGDPGGPGGKGIPGIPGVQGPPGYSI